MRSRTREPLLPIWKAKQTIYGGVAEMVPDYSDCIFPSPFNLAEYLKYKACVEFAEANPTLNCKESYRGYMASTCSSFQKSKIIDTYPVYKRIYVEKKVKYYTYPTKRCRKFYRLGDPRVSKCRKTNYKTYGYHKDVVDRTGKMKPVDHYKNEVFSLGGDIVGQSGCKVRLGGVFNKSGTKTDNMLNSSADYFCKNPITHFHNSDSPYPIGEGLDGIFMFHTGFFWKERVDCYRAIAEKLPEIAGFTMETEANLLVALIEAKEMLALFSMASYAGGPLIKLASIFLAYQFAVAPTIGDIETMMTIDKKITDAIKKWNRGVGKVRYFHYSTGENVLGSVEYVGSQTKVYLDSRSAGHATIAIVADRLNYYSIEQRLRHMGFDKPLSAVWELIPFSFILDWFTDISGYISQFETQTSPAKFTIKEACYSIKNEQYATVSPSDTATLIGETYTQHKQHYHRALLNTDYLNDVNFIKEQGGWIPSSRFGQKQATILGALALVLQPSLRR